MSKQKTQYSCLNCDYISAKWLGKCPACGSWNSLEEGKVIAEGTASSLVDVRDEFRDFRKTSGQDYVEDSFSDRERHQSSLAWVDLDVPSSTTGLCEQGQLKRLSVGISELNRVLGGGMVPDSFTLLGGDPGIGKSTLLLQMAKGLLQEQSDLKILYVSGEESIDQIRGRAYRLGIQSKGQIFLSAETQLERAFRSVKELRPDVLIMDSLQTFSSGSVQSAPGSVTQVREIAARLMTLAKSAAISVWLVGHVTKEGSIAGPKTVEHMVDTVLYFEGEGGQSYRLLRTVKNRFGSTRELGVFEMDGEGLREVLNPSSLFLSERTAPVSGTSVTAPIEGSRPLLVEIQALVTPSGLAIPRRTAVGMDTTRVSLIAAILEKHLKLPLAQQDLFFNVAGGFRLVEPACDLAAAAAIWSSAVNHPLPLDCVLIGELGLTGEVRKVSQMEARIEEARRLGFKTLILPESTPEIVIKSVLNHPSSLKLSLASTIKDLKKLFF